MENQGAVKKTNRTNKSSRAKLSEMEFIEWDTVSILSKKCPTYSLRFKSNIPDFNNYIAKLKLLGYGIYNIPKYTDEGEIIYDTSDYTKIAINNQSIIIISAKQLALAKKCKASAMFKKLKFKSVSFDEVYTSHITSMNSMFDSFEAAELDLTGLDTSKVTDMTSMFRNAYVSSIDISKFNLNKIKTMKSMFFVCHAKVVIFGDIKVGKDVDKRDILMGCIADIR